MNKRTFSPNKNIPYDLILVPIFVLLCFYLVVFQLEQSIEVQQFLTVEKEQSNLLSLRSVENSSGFSHMQRSVQHVAQYPRVSSFSAMKFHFDEPIQVSRSFSETYQDLKSNKIRLVSENPVSTFSVDVDTGGFSNIRRMLNNGFLPKRNQIRTEEIINYFEYEYTAPLSKEIPFSLVTNLINSPWNKESHLLHIGLKGYEEKIDLLPNSNIVFLVDVSGSMQDENKLSLIKKALKLLTNNLRDKDRISLVTYAGSTDVILSSTRGSDKGSIIFAIDQLGAGGGTAGESGLRLAYQEAHRGFIENGNNRIIMMTDGDFNVGLNSVKDLKELVVKKRETGIYLSTVGFGAGNYREDMMEQIADYGNGIYFYIDSYAEAERVFERNLRSNLFAIAKDVKIQIEFNPKYVSEYRLVGYENRHLERADFNNDKVDAGEVGQGHSVTAIYEITMQGRSGKVDKSRYTQIFSDAKKHSDELAYLKLRYKPIGEINSKVIKNSIGIKIIEKDNVPLNTKRAVIAASFGELLRKSSYLNRKFDYERLSNMIDDIGTYESGDIFELKKLIERARSLE